MSAVTSSPLVVVLAAGDGTRMRSALPKVLHAVAGRSLLGHVLSAAQGAGAGRVAVVVAPDRPKVAAEAHRFASGAEIFEQHERRGTAHAVLQARTAIAAQAQAAPGSAVVVLFGDTPLLRPETIRTLADAIAEGAAVAVTGFEAADPTGYGRLIREGDALRAIREHKDASESERAITLCNGGLMALRAGETLALLDSITPANAQNEYYLTDAVGIACARGLAATFRLLPETEVFGINDRVQLAEAEARLQKRLREAAMRGGATLIDPASVFFSADTIIGQDVTIEPHVVFGPGVRLEDGAIIHAFSHLEGAVVRAGASIGPFGRLRPGAEIGPKAKIGNFVEIKNAAIAEGAKISHLSYIGDAVVGADANIGAGTITCNYDGFRKFETNIGAGAFVGSNSALVAPVTIGAGAYVGSGSVITADVAPDALAVGRGRQVEKPGWAAEFRTRPENVAKRK